MVGAWEAGYEWQAIVAVFGVIISAVYLLRAVRNAYWGPRNERWDDLKDAKTPFERLPFVLLIFVLLFFGFRPQPLVHVIEGGVKPLVAAVQDAQDAMDKETGAVPANNEEEGR